MTVPVKLINAVINVYIVLVNPGITKASLVIMKVAKATNAILRTPKLSATSNNTIPNSRNFFTNSSVMVS